VYRKRGAIQREMNDAAMQAVQRVNRELN